jgi:hypothetical protein
VAIADQEAELDLGRAKAILEAKLVEQHGALLFLISHKADQKAYRQRCHWKGQESDLERKLSVPRDKVHGPLGLECKSVKMSSPESSVAGRDLQ